jgi:hypothetical protein
MEELTPIQTPDGWALTVPRAEGAALALEVIKPKVIDGAVKGVLIVRCGDAIVSDDVITLTSALKRSQLVKRLNGLGITLSERAILALDHACRVAAVPPRAAGAAEPTDDETGAVGRPLSELLAAIVEFLERYLVFRSPLHAIVVALWIAHTHVLDAFDVTPYLHVHSPQKRSGKTRLLELLEPLVRRPWRVVEPTAATVYRKIAQGDPTLLLDEVDAIFRAKESESAQALRGVVNVGYRRGATVPRCVGKQYEQLVDFPTFCPKALAGIGRLPDTIADRAVCLVFARKKKHERTERFRFRTITHEAAGLYRELVAWALTAVSPLREARPALPDDLDDRAQEIWEPLFAIADLAGGGWPLEARRVALALHAAGGEDESVGVLLLRAIREIFMQRSAASAGRLFPDDESNPGTTMPTVELLGALVERDAEPWGGWWGGDVNWAFEKGKSPTGPASKLATLLKPFGVQSRNIRTGNSIQKGYHQGDFADAFERYLPSSPPESRYTATTLGAQGVPRSDGVATTPPCSDSEMPRKPLGEKACSGVATSRGGMEPSEATEAPSSESDGASRPRCPRCGSLAWNAPINDGSGLCRTCGLVPVLTGESGNDGDLSDVVLARDHPHNPYGLTPPAVPCRICGGHTWHRAGDGWVCSTCHPAPIAPRSSDDSTGGASETATLLVLAERYGWHEVQVAPGRAVGGSESAWRRFAEFGLAPDQRAVLAALERLASPGPAR